MTPSEKRSERQVAASPARHSGAVYCRVPSSASPPSPQGIASTTAMFFLDVPYALLLGIWTTMAAIVPYIGSYIGGIPATAVAFTVSPTTGFLTALTYVDEEG